MTLAIDIIATVLAAWFLAYLIAILRDRRY